ncbi:M20/M25/M40 family metallo-hydrolase [Terrarubrum flagellatum]|uniref:M20/M25/M40 family metallo-hydrolase n=1 Tax=Terrirubrum flagellatum TaxID=2895980 RepID=UPI003144FD64
MADRLPEVLAHIDAEMDASLARLFEFVRIPSISTDPAYAADCKRASEWLAAELNKIGLAAQSRPTTGHPMVVAHDQTGEDPHVLFYGHYDVQPVDPLELWASPPFEPALVPQPNGDAWITGRGASDDKGALLTFVEACRAWKAVTGKLPVRVSMLFEGEEESGSPSLEPFLKAYREELSTDVALVCDTDMWDDQTPAITTMLRGFVADEVTVTCADRDLHSGMFGSAARNALHLLVDILAGLHGSDGRVTLPGFYDGVRELDPAVKAQWDRLGFDGEGFLANVGLSVPAGEKGRSVLEQIWVRPTCEINGVYGGYSGVGFKAVIPAKATAKVSFRLVGGQDALAVRESFRAYVRSRMPKDCSVEFTANGASPALSLPLESPLLRKALDALTEEWGREAALAGTGGSIPIVGDFKRFLGMDSLLVGFARFDNRIHAPNEKYDLSSFRKGVRSWARILASFATK